MPVFYVVIENVREHGFATAVQKFGPALHWMTDLRGSLSWLYRELAGAVKEMHGIAKEKVAKPIEDLSMELSIEEEPEPEKPENDPDKKG